jgi:hypothetical protein
MCFTILRIWLLTWLEVTIPVSAACSYLVTCRIWLTGVQLQPGVAVLVDSIWGIMFIHNLNFTGWLNSAKLSWASSHVRCLNSEYTNGLRTISVPVTWKTEYYTGCHSMSYITLLSLYLIAAQEPNGAVEWSQVLNLLGPASWSTFSLQDTRRRLIWNHDLILKLLVFNHTSVASFTRLLMYPDVLSNI